MKQATQWTTFLAVLFVFGSTALLAQREDRVPREVERAVQQRYPKARVEFIERTVRNGVDTYMVRIDTPDGETTARATENGDLVFLGYPGVTYDRLPRPVTSIIDGMFRDRPQTVQKYERTSYLVNTDLAGEKYVVQIDPVGRLVDLKPFRDSVDEALTDLPRASRQDMEALEPRLRDYFTNPRVKEAYRYPDAEGYYWVELSTDTEDYVRVLMNDRRDVARYSTRVDRKQLPQAVTRTLRRFFPRADVDQVYRHNEIHYTVLHDAGGGDALLLAVNPLGDVVRLRQADGQDLRRLLADRDPGSF
jgi:hypothetical protein